MNSPQPVAIRPGGESDEAAVLDLWDKAIAWLVARGQTGQWGAVPASAGPRSRERVREWATGNGLRIAEVAGDPAGVSVIGPTCPAHVPPTERRETYLLFLISDRTRPGLGVGRELVRHAAAEARAAGSDLLRVDCWADAPDLVAWYERQGFTRSDIFTVRDTWHGQVFEMPL